VSERTGTGLEEAWEREDALACVLQMYASAHGFVLASEGYDTEDGKRMTTRYRMAQEALDRYWEAKGDRG
jgi:hypothetical protein